MASFDRLAGLPAPKHVDPDQAASQPRGGRLVGADQINQNQVVVKKSAGPPPYGQRRGWRPRNPEDYGDGGAFPEVPVAQYPLDMGRKKPGTSGSSNALALTVNKQGEVDFTQIARRGHSENRIVHASFKDLIPLRQRADAGELDLSRPSAEEVQATKERTEAALGLLVASATAAQRPKNVNVTKKKEPTYVRYTPADQMGDKSKKQDRIIKIVERQRDPMEPPKFKHKKIPRGPPSPPPPVMHSPPRKLTAEDQEAWKIPPPVSNWKNPKGYTIALDKRLASDGRELQDVSMNDKFAQLSEALNMADRNAREGVQQRAKMQQILAEKEKAQKEENLRKLAQQAREERANASRRRSHSSRSPRGRRSRGDSYDSRSDSEDEAARERREMRKERRRENERELRQSRMGTERKIQMMAREQGRDISEKIALGLAKPTASAESMYDSRLFNQSSGLNTGFNEDQPYDKPLFAAQEAIHSIYRPRVNADEEEDGGETYDNITKANRFEILGKAKEGFKGAREAEEREGPVQFERDTDDPMAKGVDPEADKDDDPFGIGELINKAKHGTKRYGMQESEREAKRKRMDDDDD